MTPTLARMVGARAGGMRKPIKWFSIPQLFRYERQQRGRLREHFQLNLDIVGRGRTSRPTPSCWPRRSTCCAPSASRTRTSWRASRTAGCCGRSCCTRRCPRSGSRSSTTSWTSWSASRARPSRQRLSAEAGLGPAVVEEVLGDLPAPRLRRGARRLRRARRGSRRRSPACTSFFGQLEAMGLGDYVRFDLSVVRGLAYYTGMVFELFDARGELRAICGGGRYDDAPGSWSRASDLPALGFGMGDVVLRELLADRGPPPGRPAAPGLLPGGGDARASAPELLRAGPPPARRGPLGGLRAAAPGRGEAAQGRFRRWGPRRP